MIFTPLFKAFRFRDTYEYDFIRRLPPKPYTKEDCPDLPAPTIPFPTVNKTQYRKSRRPSYREYTNANTQNPFEYRDDIPPYSDTFYINAGTPGFLIHSFMLKDVVTKPPHKFYKPLKKLLHKSNITLIDADLNYDVLVRSYKLDSEQPYFLGYVFYYHESDRKHKEAIEHQILFTFSQEFLVKYLEIL